MNGFFTQNLQTTAFIRVAKSINVMHVVVGVKISCKNVQRTKTQVLTSIKEKRSLDFGTPTFLVLRHFNIYKKIFFVSFRSPRVLPPVRSPS